MHCRNSDSGTVEELISTSLVKLIELVTYINQRMKEIHMISDNSAFIQVSNEISESGQT